MLYIICSIQIDHEPHGHSNQDCGGNPVAMSHVETPRAIKKTGGSKDMAVQKLNGTYIWSNSGATNGLEQVNCLSE